MQSCLSALLRILIPKLITFKLTSCHILPYIESASRIFNGTSQAIGFHGGFRYVLNAIQGVSGFLEVFRRGSHALTCEFQGRFSGVSKRSNAWVLQGVSEGVRRALEGLAGSLVSFPWGSRGSEAFLVFSAIQ